MIYSCFIWSTNSEGDLSPFLLGHITKRPDKHNTDNLAMMLVNKSVGYVDKDYRQELGEEVDEVEVFQPFIEQTPYIHYWSMEVSVIIAAKSGRKINATLDFFIELSEKLS